MKPPFTFRPNWTQKQTVTIIVIVLLAIGNLLAWWWVAQARTELHKAAQTDSTTPSVITVAAEKRTISKTVTADCLTQPEFTNSPPLSNTSTEDAQAVITALPKKKGDKVSAGDVITEISSRPVFAAQGDIRSFRTMKIGMRGADVEQLHAFLQGLGLYSGKVKSNYSVATGDAVKRLYSQSGYEASFPDPDAVKTLKATDRLIERARRGQDVEGETIPSQDEYEDMRRNASPQVPMGEIVFLARTPATLSTMNLQIGQTPQDGQLVTTSGKDVLRCSVQTSELPSLSKGQKVNLDAGPSSADLEVTSIHTEDGSDTEEPVAESSSAADGALADSEQSTESAYVIVNIPKDSEPYQGPAHIEIERGPENTLAVPATAVRTDETGATYVRVHRDGEEPARINVTVEFEADGNAAVSSSELAESDLVEITQ